MNHNLSNDSPADGNPNGNHQQTSALGKTVNDTRYVKDLSKSNRDFSLLDKLHLRSKDHSRTDNNI